MSNSLIQVENTAREVSRAWGEIGTSRKRFKWAEFKRIVVRFTKLVYKLKLDDFGSAEQFERVEKLIQLMIAITEAWVVTQYDSRHIAECQTFGELINRLRIALEGVRQGLPPNPTKRPSREQIDQTAEASLFEILTPNHFRHCIRLLPVL